ncbi:MAG: hypothetical protein KJO40_13500 [Deltaproteobacteria bacterium]|nr:hypothetical protein [Deltaproteobacteria bacterium]
MARKNPDMTTWLLLGGVALGAYLIFKAKKGEPAKAKPQGAAIPAVGGGAIKGGVIGAEAPSQLEGMGSLGSGGLGTLGGCGMGSLGAC